MDYGIFMGYFNDDVAYVAILFFKHIIEIYDDMMGFNYHHILANLPSQHSRLDPNSQGPYSLEGWQWALQTI